MIAYFDTSALVPLLIDEPSTSTCQELWEQADDVLQVSRRHARDLRDSLAQPRRTTP